MTKKFDQLLQTLREDKVSEKEIRDIVKVITQMTAGKYHTELMLNFTAEEVEEINKVRNQQKAEEIIRTLFYEKTGKSADQLRDEIIDYFAEETLEEYKRKKGE